MIVSDILIIGSGISGLTYAIKVAEASPEANIIIVTKADEDESNTKYAQGGLAVVTDFEKDNLEAHIQDTLKAGDGENDENIVRIVITEGPERFRELQYWGANFDKNDDGLFRLGREGGHTANRIVHHKDITGFEIERALLQYLDKLPNITTLDHHYVIDLITEHQLRPKKFPAGPITAYGAYVFNTKTGKVETYASKITMIATGGAGQVYKNTTNPLIATGDGIAFGHRAGALTSNMQYIQFHPTALYSRKDGMLFLISEAVRGDGAILRLPNGERFMKSYDPREEMASRDIVARAIDNEMKIHGLEFVCLDCTHMDPQKFKEHFPNIYAKCQKEGIDPMQEYIPVVPACHYFMGGISCNPYGQTSVINLFAIGECTNSGLHGANRLASNSLLEGLVFGHRASEKSTELLKNGEFDSQLFSNIPDWEDDGLRVMEEKIILTYFRKQLQELMSDLVSIVRTDERLALAKKKQQDIYDAVKELYTTAKLSSDLIELRNLVEVSYLIIKDSIRMKKNKGSFYNKSLEKSHE